MIKVAFLFDKNNDWLMNFYPATFANLDRFEIHKFYDPQNIKGFDLVFVLGYTKILRGDFLKLNKLIMVVHESDLPLGKGFAPVQWQILEGKKRIKISLIELIDKVDCGDILEQMDLVLKGTELYEEIRSAQAEVTFSLIEKVLEKYPYLSRRQQTGVSSFYRKRTPEDSELDVDKSIRELFPLLSIGNNEGWPSFFKLNGETYVLHIYKQE